ncbi:MAG: acetoacetate decarboxylase family protein [Dehalococcoidales bacterium]|nr:acetoacetate decarboxylase family protein [Dehalococcoidales bacterium]
MSYRFIPGRMYRMPTHFGPSLGPRQGPQGRKFSNFASPKTTMWSVSFLTNRGQLSDLLPPGFTVGAEPVVTVQASYMTEIEWLAGRGYNTLGVSFPAVFTGKRSRASGNFLSVLWENMADPIITGRDDLGFNKIYCELPEPATNQGETHCIAAWMGFKFMDLKVWNLRPLSTREIRAATSRPTGDGMLHYKYIPRTGDWGEADIAYATLTPAATPNRTITEMWRGEGSVDFHQATWEELPTLVDIVNTFHALEIKEYRGAMMAKTIGGKDLSDQRILR